MTANSLIRCLALGISLLFCLTARAEDGVSSDEIRLGMVNAQSGPAAALGTGMQAGVEAYLTRINAAGGVHGRNITLTVKDDGYEPARTAELTRELIQSKNTFALLGYVGTPTSRAAVPIAVQAQIPYLFPFSGAESLRKPVKPGVFNLRASYFDEAEALVALMTDQLGIKKVALLMQNDSFGESVKAGINGALNKRGISIRAESRITRNSLEVATAVIALKLAEPEAVVFVGTYLQLASALKLAKTVGLNARFFTVSFIGTDSFIAAAGPLGDGVYISQVMPSPHDPSLPIVRQYLTDISPASASYTSLEGYLDAAVFVSALQLSGPQPTRTKLVSALQTLKSDFGGFKVAFAPSNHQGSNAVFLTRIEDGTALPVTQSE